MHLGLLAYAQAPSVSETELLEYDLISRGYYSGFVHVCFCERTIQGVNPQTVPEMLHLCDTCNGILVRFYGGFIDFHSLEENAFNRING